MNRLEALFFVLLLIPSAFVAWSNRDMPQFGSTHDDSIYFVGAKAWATGHGHRILSLPGQPWQTKYPPLYPLLLSSVWLVSPDFPQNLRVAGLLSWSFLPPMLLLTYYLFRRYGFAKWQAWLMLTWIAINPYVHIFGTSLLSELPFTCLLLAVLAVAPVSPVAAGLLAGLAYLTRAAGLPLLIAVPLIFALRRQWRPAAVFAASMLPFVAGWMLWSGAHKLQSGDPYLMYYIDYAWYERYIVRASNVHLVLWKNVDALLTGIGSFILPESGNLLEKLMVQMLGIATLIGTYKLTRSRPGVSMYAVFGVFFCGLLIVWHYPPIWRFVFPLLPLLLAGFAHQLGLTFSAIRHAYTAGGQRPAAVVLSCLLAILAIFVMAGNYRFITQVERGYYRDQRAMSNEMLDCAARMSSVLPADARVMTNRDPVLFLLTGRKAMRMTVPPIYWYEDRLPDAETEWRRLPQVAREHGMTHLFYTRKIHGDLSEEQQHKFMTFLDASAPKVLECGDATVYRVP